MSQVAVTINGKTYRMACDEGQENHLLGLAQKLDGYVGHLRGSFGEIGDQRLTIMAGVMVVDELSELQKKMQALEAKFEKLKSSREKALSSNDKREESVQKGLSAAAERLDKLTGKLGSIDK